MRQENLINKDKLCVIDNREKCGMGTNYSAIVPINGSGKDSHNDAGKVQPRVCDEDLVLAEYGATVVGWKYCAPNRKK